MKRGEALPGSCEAARVIEEPTPGGADHQAPALGGTRPSRGAALALRLERRRVVLVAATTGALGAVLDLFCLLLLPVRVAGHLAPAAPLAVLVVNAVLGTIGNRIARDRVPAQVLLGVGILLSVMAATRGPGGDLLVTRDLEGMYLLFVLAACLGAAVPLFRRARPS
jgi:hypothetical protein